MTKITSKQILIYCGIIFIFSWLLQISAIIITKNINDESARPYLVATMFVPLLVTIYFLFTKKSLRKYLLWKPNKKIFWVSVLSISIPTLSAFLILFLIVQFRLGNSGWFSFTSSNVNISGGPWLLGLGNQNWIKFILNIFLTGVVYSLINGIIATGEEFAWRGFLQQLLTERFGKLKGLLILGVIWSMWHLPAQLAGYNFSENPILGSFLFSPIELIAGSFFFGWMTIKTNSFIPAAIAHGAINSIHQGIVSNINLQAPVIYEHLIKMLVFIIIASIFFLLLRKDKLHTTTHAG